MLTSDLKIAWRSLRKNSAFSSISIFGLAFGLACCLLLLLWLRDELSYDRFHARADRIFRVEHSDFRDGRDIRIARTSAPLGPALRAEFPEIERTVRFGSNGFQVAYENRRFRERIFFADPEVFEVFDFPLVKGDPRAALSGPSNILISEDAARKYFGEKDPVGKTLVVKDYRDFTITGVFRTIPAQSHIHFDFLGQFAGYAGRTVAQWGIYNYYTYVLTKPGFGPADLQAKFPAFIRKYQGNIPAEARFRYELQALTRIHLRGRARGEIEANGQSGTISIFSAVVLFILLIACFNYVNFATAQYASRMREVGVRKAVGAGRREVAFQFLRESLFTSLIALAAAFLLAEILLPVFSALTAKTFSANFLHYPDILAAGLGLGLLTGLIAGSYPALFLSSAPPVLVLKGTIQGKPRAAAVRNVLVAAQFVVSIIFLVGTIVIARQMHHIRTLDLGLDKDNVLIVPVQDESALARLAALEQEVGRLPGVAGVAASSFRPGPQVWRQNYWREGMAENEFPMIAWMAVDYGFIKTLGIEITAGRDFSRQFASDAGGAYILNDSAVRELGWASPEEAVGRAFKIVDKGTIVGVVRNFNFDSLHSEIESLALCVYEPGLENLYVRLRDEPMAETLAGIGRIWRDMAPRQEFSYAFLDDEYDGLYKAEVRLGRVFGSVTAASIIIAGLGLVGLAALAARYRTKEIGVRKVLGASTAGIVTLLSRDFLRWILAANIVAWPVAHYAMSRWLRNFAYRTPVSLWIFLTAGGLTLGLALLAVWGQSLKAARANPVESLRNE
ncbi:MAG: ABC transporter permease [Candidatus Aminicenantes bacterium]|nr:ABC transporter permease [Candidatus Aminicenantes bacterium]